MRLFICASGFAPFMTNLRKLEDKRNDRETDFKGTEGRSVLDSAHRGAWFCRHEPVEFFDAASVRLASDQLLAGGGPLASEQDPLRRISWWPGQAHVLASPHEGALGAHDPGGARELSRRHARSFPAIWAVRCATEGLSRGGIPALSCAAATFCIAFRLLFAYYRWLFAGKSRSHASVFWRIQPCLL